MRTDSTNGYEEQPSMEQRKHRGDDVAEIPEGEDNKLKRGQKLALGSMLEQITSHNLHPEWDTGPLIGKEIW